MDDIENRIVVNPSHGLLDITDDFGFGILLISKNKKPTWIDSGKETTGKQAIEYYFKESKDFEYCVRENREFIEAMKEIDDY